MKSFHVYLREPPEDPAKPPKKKWSEHHPKLVAICRIPFLVWFFWVFGVGFIDAIHTGSFCLGPGRPRLITVKSNPIEFWLFVSLHLEFVILVGFVVIREIATLCRNQPQEK